MVGSEMLSYMPFSENHQETELEYRHYCRTQCVRSNSRQHFKYSSALTLCRHPSFGYTRIVIVLLHMACLCLRPCDGGVNCSSYDVNCYHGTCKVRLPSKGANHTVKVDCLCDDRWSGPACNVFTCKGRTL